MSLMPISKYLLPTFLGLALFSAPLLVLAQASPPPSTAPDTAHIKPPAASAPAKPLSTTTSALPKVKVNVSGAAPAPFVLPGKAGSSSPATSTSSTTTAAATGVGALTYVYLGTGCAVLGLIAIGLLVGRRKRYTPPVL